MWSCCLGEELPLRWNMAAFRRSYKHVYGSGTTSSGLLEVSSLLVFIRIVDARVGTMTLLRDGKNRTGQDRMGEGRTGQDRL